MDYTHRKAEKQTIRPTFSLKSKKCLAKIKKILLNIKNKRKILPKINLENSFFIYFLTWENLPNFF
jgi:hypothetical protein